MKASERGMMPPTSGAAPVLVRTTRSWSAAQGDGDAGGVGIGLCAFRKIEQFFCQQDAVQMDGTVNVGGAGSHDFLRGCSPETSAVAL